MNTQVFWSEMSDLYNFALGTVSQHEGQHACFCLTLSDHVVVTGADVLIKAVVNDAAQMICARRNPMFVEPRSQDTVGGTVILRASTQDYEVLLRRVKEVRVLQAFISCQQSTVIIDATQGPSFFAGAMQTQCHEVLQIAEVFAGGFAGWSRAVASLRGCGLPIHVSWILERDSACRSPLHVMDSGLVEATMPDDIPPHRQPTDTVLLVADFRDSWWRRVVHLRPVDVALFSPPCQPWSSASYAEGLGAEDGLGELLEGF